MNSPPMSGEEKKFLAMPLEPKVMCNGFTNSQELQCGHRVSAGRSHYSPVEYRKYEVTVCATNGRNPGKRRPFLCAMCLIELAATGEEELYVEACRFK